MTEYERGQKDMKQRAQRLCYGLYGNEVKCNACNGSGHYDNTGSPECGSCNGSGSTKPSPGDVAEAISKMAIRKR